MEISANLVAKIIALPSPYIQRWRNTIRFTLVLTVEEGIACRFSSASWADLLPDDIACEFVTQIGWKRIEHAPARITVIRCIVSNADPNQAQCQIDLGTGFEPLNIQIEGA
jgi:hypothetical protein